MDTVIKLTGIFCEIIVLSVFVFCGLKVKKFDIKKETFSHLGSAKETSKIFNTGIFFYLFFRSIFINKIIGYFSLWSHLLLVTSYIIAFASIFFAAIFTVKKHSLIHFVVTRLAVIVSILFLITLSITLIIKDFYLGIFNFIIFLSLLIIGARFLLRKKTNAVFQIYFFIPIIIWDWVMTLKLFNII